MAATSMESVMTSRLTREARMPSVPMETPSLTEMVLISMGVPPAARTPSLTRWAMRRWLKLQGMVSIHSCATPTMGRARSSSEKPMDLSWERAGARAGPSVMAALLRLRGSDMEVPYEVEADVGSRYMVGAEARGFKGDDARIVVTGRRRLRNPRAAARKTPHPNPLPQERPLQNPEAVARKTPHPALSPRRGKSRRPQGFLTPHTVALPGERGLYAKISQERD